MIFEKWPAFMVSVIISLILCIILAPTARKVGLLDRPSKRKVHKRPIPLVGGLAIYFAMLIVITLASPFSLEARPLLVACGVMLITGVTDDRKGLSAYIRFVIQILATCIMIFAGDVVLTDFGSLMWDGVLPLGWLSVPVTIFAALGVINAFNMMDGIDGLSSTVFIIASLAMAWLALSTGHDSDAAFLIITAGAVFGFFLLNARFPWNKRARIFLGDSGSLLLGFMLAWQFIHLGNGENRAFAPITAGWLFAIPLLDTTFVMLHRWRNGDSAFAADKHHLHHAFLKAGFSVRQTAFAITTLLLCTTLIGLTGEFLNWPEYLMFYSFLGFGAVYYSIMRTCWRKGRFLGRRVALDPS